MRTRTPIRVSLAGLAPLVLAFAACQNETPGAADAGAERKMFDGSFENLTFPEGDADAGRVEFDATICSSVAISVEAEDASYIDGFEIRESSDPAIGAYIIDTGTDWYGSGGVALFDVDLPCTATYRIWGRALWAGSHADSMYFGFDDQYAQVWDFMQCPAAPEPRPGWYWDVVSAGPEAIECDPMLLDDPFLVRLTKGRHLLFVGTREYGMGLDKLVVTNDEGYDPAANFPPPGAR